MQLYNIICCVYIEIGKQKKELNKKQENKKMSLTQMIKYIHLSVAEKFS